MNFKLATFLAFMIICNLLLWWGQIGVTELANESSVPTTIFFNYDGSPVSQLDAGNYTVNTNSTDFIPTGQGQVEIDGGNIFTDTFRAIKDWLLQTTGLNYVIGYLNAVPSFIKAIGAPTPIAFGLGILWHSISVFLIIAFIAGRDP